MIKVCQNWSGKHCRNCLLHGIFTLCPWCKRDLYTTILLLRRFSSERFYWHLKCLYLRGKEAPRHSSCKHQRCLTSCNTPSAPDTRHASHRHVAHLPTIFVTSHCTDCHIITAHVLNGSFDESKLTNSTELITTRDATSFVVT
jgi:hypothetical protein